MTDGEKAIWKQVQSDYQNARLIALAVMPNDTPPEVMQAATATILIQKDKAAGRANYAAPKATPAAQPANVHAADVPTALEDDGGEDPSGLPF